MTTLGLRELRQHASELVRRAEIGESLIITVSGRPAAVLGPYVRGTWRTFAEVRDVFESPTDPGWSLELGGFDETLRDPWQG
ncbi:MAG: type II toxin-antitoxin system prevent-host-death family antitoxin [Actinomycetota bacterium]|nr:type II toxin-antitoxin system prevent-host-death family antitoxin [Actinomycetota bacterium]